MGKKTTDTLVREKQEQRILQMFDAGEIGKGEQVTITNLRHREALEQALNSLLLVRESVGQGLPEDFFTIDLMEAYRQLGLILGEEVGEDLVNEIFSKFCMGK